MSLEKHLKDLEEGRTRRLTLGGVAATGWGYVVARVVAAWRRAGAARAAQGRPAADGGPVLVVCPEPGMVAEVAAGLAALLPALTVREFPAWDVQPYDRLGPDAEVQGQRISIQGALESGQGAGLVLVTSVAALGVRLPGGGAAAPTALAPGMSVAPEGVARQLAALGYEHRAQVDAVGQFARRGGVMDVWPAGDEGPLRLEWFDDDIESVRRFDPVSQVSDAGSYRSTGPMVIGPAREVILDEERAEVFRRQYREAFGAEAVEDEAYETVSAGRMPPYAAQLLPLFYELSLPGLLDLLPADTLAIVPDSLGEVTQVWEEGVTAAYQARKGATGGLRAVAPERLCVPAAELLGGLGKLTQVELARFLEPGGAGAGVREHGWTLATRGNRHAAAVAAAREIGRRAAEGWTVVVTAAAAPALAQMVRALEAEGAPAARVAAAWSEAKGGGVVALVAPFAAGWVDDAARLMVVAEGDIFGARSGARVRRRRSPEEMIAHFSELHDGDYVVHEQHGIGRFMGLATLDINGARQDFLRLVYAGDDRLLVPVANLDALSRYKGGDAGEVVLDKLGTGGWQARKEKVREDLLAMADELLAVAAARELVTRPPVPRGVGLYDEFCAAFPFDLTDDQQSVMEEVEEDLAAGVPMDRLVVGDVGFGKTEVALRTAFLFAAAGRQVAVVCPTTLLARQHLDVFGKRFAGFPMKVGGLSRLVAARDATRVKEGLAKGEIDIVIGTHALLGSGIKFKNLGLVVIDEEQRFGVAHKERLKKLRDAVDVLTLTATPIPRTLQLAVGGVRQLSLITTPPVDRRAVQTHVLNWDNQTLREAVRRELTRGGQVYFVAPHIEDLAQLEADLAGLVPEARVGVAHGRMGEAALEEVMTRFYAGELDVLLATTIIESGLDVANANTLIVYNADRFGLGQLYQLRGRVGRSTARAFAYFILPPHVGGDAARRLEILQRLDGLGAGFTLASYDMDLRGFGNLLGKQQSGHIRDIGFELYAKMLRDAVQQRRMQRAAGRAPEEEPERPGVSLKLAVTYLIPEHYVSDTVLRLQLYRRLAGLHGAGEVEEFRRELADRFGPVPVEVTRLLQVMELRNRAAALNVSRLEVGEKGVVVGFHQGEFAAPERLLAYVMQRAGVVSVRPEKDGSQILIWHKPVPDGEGQLAVVAWVVSELEGLISA
jgi:transcription-repair coupling factor (superfamily II helicase)